MARVDFELAYDDIAVHHFNQYATGTPLYTLDGKLIYPLITSILRILPKQKSSYNVPFFILE